MINKKILSALVIGSMIVMQAPLLILAQTMPAMDAPAPADTAPMTEPAPAPTEPASESEPVMDTVAPADTAPPVISDVMVASIAPDHATIVWSTDEPATSTLRYGTTEAYGTNAMLDPGAALMHTTTLTGLAASTTYFYCIDATDTSGNRAESCGHSFVTADAPTPMDTNPPTITSVTVDPITETGATITWTTDEVADGYVEYGTTPDFGTETPLVSDYSTDHTAAISGLTAGTEYFYRVVSADQTGNTAESTTNNFTTTTSAPAEEPSAEMPPAEETTTPPASEPAPAETETAPHAVITNVEVSTVTETSATITWTTDMAANREIEYGDSEHLGTTTTLDETRGTSHSVSVSNLTPNTNYFFKVRSSAQDQTSPTISNLHEFTTLAEPVFTSTPAKITSVTSSSVSATGATVAWMTDMPATSGVQYGLSTEYGQTQNAGTETSDSHSITLADLAPETLYHYRVTSVNEAGDITYSNDHTFTTSASPQSSPASGSGEMAATPLVIASPDRIETLSISSSDDVSATLAWSVSRAEADAAQIYDIRYSTSPITADNFAQATAAQTSPIYYPDVSPDGTARSYIVAGLDPGTKYYFVLRSKYEESEWSPVSNVASVTLETVQEEAQAENAPVPISSVGGSISHGGGGGSPAYFSPTLLNASGTDSEITLTWQNSGSSAFARTVVVRKEGGYPAYPSDGQVIYEGQSETFTDTGLTNGTKYYYGIYAYDHGKTYSVPIHVSLAPEAGQTDRELHENPVIVPTTPSYHFSDVFQKGDTDIEVRHLQVILSATGDVYPEGHLTGYFGPLTENALKRFQDIHNLPQTGITDAATQAKLQIASQTEVKLSVPENLVVYNTDLHTGHTGDDVGALQRFLIIEGSYKEALVTNYFGTYTKNAVIAFQKKYDIEPAVGYVGPITRHKIRAISGF